MKKIAINILIIIMLLFFNKNVANIDDNIIIHKRNKFNVGKIKEHKKQYNNTNVKNIEISSRSKEDGVAYTITCYDLSVQSCGKSMDNKNYGITATGFDLKGHTWETARAISVDPDLIPLGSKVEIRFLDENHRKYDGIYTAVDTGSAIKGRKIDFFLGDFQQEEPHKKALEFGKTKAKVRIIE